MLVKGATVIHVGMGPLPTSTKRPMKLFCSIARQWDYSISHVCVIQICLFSCNIISCRFEIFMDPHFSWFSHLHSGNLVSVKYDMMIIDSSQILTKPSKAGRQRIFLAMYNISYRLLITDDPEELKQFENSKGISICFEIWRAKIFNDQILYMNAHTCIYNYFLYSLHSYYLKLKLINSKMDRNSWYHEMLDDPIPDLKMVINLFLTMLRKVSAELFHL